MGRHSQDSSPPAARRRYGRAALLLGLGLALPGLAQDAPKSLLPDVFRETPAPRPAPPAPEAPKPPEAAPAGPTSPAEASPPATGARPQNRDSAALLLPAPLEKTPPGIIGPLLPRQGGYGAHIWDSSNGQFNAALMRRIAAPLASRWSHIVLRRTLLSAVPTPVGVKNADWIAARAGLLVRMGEADGARLLVAQVDVKNYTPRLYQIAGRTYLANADLAALCPLSLTAGAILRDSLWKLMQGVCAGLDGDDVTAATLLETLRKKRQATGFDIILAERAVAVAVGNSKSANISWDNVARATLWHYAVATATQSPMPEDKLGHLTAAVHGWRMRAPQLTLEERISAADNAARLGAASTQELVALTSALANSDVDGTLAQRAELLRTAYTSRDMTRRIVAMRSLWRMGESADELYALHILTAQAAARIPPALGQVEAAPLLLASMLSAGYVDRAAAWWPVLAKSQERIKLSGWPYAVLADRSDQVPATPNLFRAWWKLEKSRHGEDRARRRAQLLFAALVGLGKTDALGWNSVARDVGFKTLDNSWTRRLAIATRDRLMGESLLLSMAGLQGKWPAVPASHVAAIVYAWRMAGLSTEARLFAAEALSRG